jgi:hypothetical protein
VGRAADAQKLAGVEYVDTAAGAPTVTGERREKALMRR